jgi:hypothetical protein
MRFERQNHQEWPSKRESAHRNAIFQQPASATLVGYSGLSWLDFERGPSNQLETVVAEGSSQVLQSRIACLHYVEAGSPLYPISQPRSSLTLPHYCIIRIPTKHSDILRFPIRRSDRGRQRFGSIHPTTSEPPPRSRRPDVPTSRRPFERSTRQLNRLATLPS